MYPPFAKYCKKYQGKVERSFFLFGYLFPGFVGPNEPINPEKLRIGVECSTFSNPDGTGLKGC